MVAIHSSADPARSLGTTSLKMFHGIPIVFTLVLFFLIITPGEVASESYWMNGMGPVNNDWQWGTGRSEQYVSVKAYGGTFVWAFNDPGEGSSFPSKLIVGRTRTRPDAWFAEYTRNLGSTMEVVVASTTGSTPIKSSVATNQNGTWIIAFSAKMTPDTDYDIFYVRSTDDGVSWSTISRLDSRGSSETNLDDAPILLFEPSEGKFWCSWITKQTYAGPNGQMNTNGDQDIAVTSSVDSSGNSWSLATYANDNWQNNWEDEKSVTMFLGSPPGTIHVAFSTSAYPNLNLTASGYDYVIVTKNASSSIWGHARILNPDQGRNVTNYSDEQYSSTVASDGQNVVFAYYRVLQQSWVYQVMFCVSRDGGWSFDEPLLLDSNVQSDSGLTVATDFLGTFNIIYTSKKSSYTYDGGATVQIGLGSDAELFYTIVTLPVDKMANASFTRPKPIDFANLLIPTPSSDNGDNKSPVSAVDPLTGDWFTMFLSSKKNCKLNGQTWYNAAAVEYNVMASAWVQKRTDLCLLNDPTIPVYCLANLRQRVAAVADNSVSYTEIKVDYIGSFETMKITNNKWISISPAFQLSSVEIGQSASNFEILDASSRLLYYSSGMLHTGGSFLVKNIGATPHVYIQPGNFSGFACPLGYFPPPLPYTTNSFCEPCPAGQVCTNRAVSTPTRTCRIGRYCPAGTFDEEEYICRVYRHYTDPGYTAPENCTTGGTACVPGYFCPPGALTSQHVPFVNVSSNKFDETIVFPTTSQVLLEVSLLPNGFIPAGDPLGQGRVYFNSGQRSTDPNFPLWLTVSTGTAVSGLNGGSAELTATLASKVAGVSISETLSYDYELGVRHISTLEDMIKPIKITFLRTVTTVVFNPEEGISDHVSIYSAPFSREMLIFNVGCESSLNWTARVINCTHPASPLDWAGTQDNAGVIALGSIDPASINVDFSLNSSIQPGGQLYQQILAQRALDETRGTFTARACLDVRFIMINHAAENTTGAELKKISPIQVRFFETCSPGRFSPSGNSEDGSCDACPSGSYAPDRGAVTCRACPEELPRTIPGAVSHKDCLAAPGTFLDSDGKVFRCDTLGDGAECLDDGTTLQSVTVKEGYWRSTKVSKVIMKCVNPQFCRGSPGATHRRLLQDVSNQTTNEYCIDYHLGPMCEGCVENYVRRGASPCAICDEAAIAGDRLRLGWTLFAAVLIVVIAFLIVQWTALVKFIRKRRETIMASVPRRISIAANQFSSKSQTQVSDDGQSKPRPRSQRRTPAEFVRTVSTRVRVSTKIDKRLTLLWSVVVSLEANTTIRILLSLFQVTNGVSKTFYDLLPPGFHAISAAFNVVSAELFYRIDFGCILKSNHNLSLILSMSAPLALTFLIVVIHLVMERRLRVQKRLSDVSKLRNGSFSIFLLLLFLIYPGVSNTILSTFACREFDGGLRYLRKDLTVSCDAPDRHLWLTLAGFGVAIYVIGIPVFYMQALFRVRKYLNPTDGSKPDQANFPSVIFLTSIYKPKYYWWEVFELLRKLIQTSVIVFIVDGSLLQTIFMITFTMLVVMLINELKPYISSDANRLAYVAQWQILIISFLTLLYRVDLSEIDRNVGYDKKAMLDVCVMTACFLAPGLALYQSRNAILKFMRFVSHKLSNSCCCRPCFGNRSTLSLTITSKIDEEDGVEVEQLGDRTSSRISTGAVAQRDGSSA